MKKILRSRLPERLAHRLPPVVVEAAIGIAAAIVLVAVRVPVLEVAGDRAPYALNFLAVVLAAVLAGWRSGLVTLVLGQILIWFAIVPPHWDFAIADSERLFGLIIATWSQLLVLLAIGLYQREVDKGAAEGERRLQLLDDALREIDHRTKNNYQTVLALIHLQAQRSADSKVKASLQQVADRIQAVTSASEQLAHRSGQIVTVRLNEHLCDLCEHIERGLSREEIVVDCEVPEVPAEATRALSISLIVNELVTNALKHAFRDGAHGRVRVAGRMMNGSGFELTVEDNGVGMKPQAQRGRTGLGTKLVENFVRQLGAIYEMSSSENGTTHRLLIPSLH